MKYDIIAVLQVKCLDSCYNAIAVCIESRFLVQTHITYNSVNSSVTLLLLFDAVFHVDFTLVVHFGSPAGDAPTWLWPIHITYHSYC
jgi:hypothetical protein